MPSMSNPKTDHGGQAASILDPNYSFLRLCSLQRYQKCDVISLLNNTLLILFLEYLFCYTYYFINKIDLQPIIILIQIYFENLMLIWLYI